MVDETPAKESVVNLLKELAVGAVVIGSLSYLISTFFGLREDAKLLVVGIALAVGLTVMTYVWGWVKSYPDNVGRRYMSERTGIVRTFPNLDACREDMQAEFKRAKEIRLLLQIGRKEFGNSEASYFYSLVKEKNVPGPRIKILRASEQSPFLSEARAQFRMADVERWRKDIERLGGELQILKRNSKVQIEERLHHEPYLWRIFIFDDVAYVSAYLLPREVDSMCVVYKIQKDSESSLYSVFEKYFEYLWLKYDPTDDREPQERWATWA